MGVPTQVPNQRIIRDVPVSFETGEIGALKVYFPYRVRITKIRSIVTKALAATNNGTITGANSVGDSTTGVVTHLASAAIGNEISVSPGSNYEVAAGSYYQLTTAKGAAGGKAFVTLEAVTL